MLCCRARVLQIAVIFLLNRDKKNFKAESTTLTRRSSERESRGTYMHLGIKTSFHHMQLCDVICAARVLLASVVVVVVVAVDPAAFLSFPNP